MCEGFPESFKAEGKHRGLVNARTERWREQNEESMDCIICRK